VSGVRQGPPRRSGSSPGRPHGAHPRVPSKLAGPATRDSCATRSIAAGRPVAPVLRYRFARSTQPSGNLGRGVAGPGQALTRASDPRKWTTSRSPPRSRRRGCGPGRRIRPTGERLARDIRCVMGDAVGYATVRCVCSMHVSAPRAALDAAKRAFASGSAQMRGRPGRGYGAGEAAGVDCLRSSLRSKIEFVPVGSSITWILSVSFWMYWYCRIWSFRDAARTLFAVA
jgi:hypothetical protein